MTTTTRTRRTPTGKHDERRKQLAESALRTLGERGYARTSLREIATNSQFSHGVVHYYFDDKLDLIIYCLRLAAAQNATRYDLIVAESRTADALLDAFCANLVESLREEAPLHRLWFDLRTQSMFEESLREAVSAIDTTLEEMLWRVIERYSELSGRPATLPPAGAYGVLDGVLQQALRAHLLGRPGALDTIVEQVHALLPLMLAPAPG